MSDLDQKNKTDLAGNRSPDKRRKGAPLIIITSLLLGIAVLVGLFFLRANEKGDPLMAANLAIRLSSSEQIQKWIVDEMQKQNAKVGVVNIWATWCEPCRTEMPELAKFQKQGHAPLFLVSADNEVDERLVRAFLHEKGVDFESALVKGDQQVFIETWQRLSSKDPSKQWSMTLPATFLVDAAGDVISFHVGTTTADQLAHSVKNARGTP